jgi:hypothetical protein
MAENGNASPHEQPASGSNKTGNEPAGTSIIKQKHTTTVAQLKTGEEAQSFCVNDMLKYIDIIQEKEKNIKMREVVQNTMLKGFNETCSASAYLFDDVKDLNNFVGNLSDTWFSNDKNKKEVALISKSGLKAADKALTEAEFVVTEGDEKGMFKCTAGRIVQRVLPKGEGETKEAALAYFLNEVKYRISDNQLDDNLKKFLTDDKDMPEQLKTEFFEYYQERAAIAARDHFSTFEY